MASPPAVGLMDPCHVTLQMALATDTQRYLSRPSSKIKSCHFFLFRWTPNFVIGKDSPMAAVWVKMYNILLQYFNESAPIRLGSVLGTVYVFALPPRIFQHIYARLCIEIDVSKPLLESLLMGTSKEEKWPVFLEYKGNIAFCSHCGLLGHMFGLYRKKYPHLAKANTEKAKSFSNTKDGGKLKVKTLTLLRGTFPRLRPHLYFETRRQK